MEVATRYKATWLIALLFCMHIAPAQKKPLDYTALGSWPEIGGEKISDNGRFVIYHIRSKATGSNADWYVKATDNSWQRQLRHAAQVSITADSRYVVYGNDADSIVVYDPVNDATEVVLPGNSYQLATNGNHSLLACGYRAGKGLHLYDVTQKKTRIFPAALSFELAGNGHDLLIVMDSAGGKLVKWIDLAGNAGSIIATGAGHFAAFAFDGPAQQLAFTEDLGSSIEPYVRLRYFKKGMDSSIVKVSPGAPGIDSGYTLRTIAPRFDATCSKIFFSVSNKTSLPEKDKTKADVTVWHYNDVYLPDEQVFQLNNTGLYTAVVSTDHNKVIQLTRRGTNPLVTNVSTVNTDFVIVSDRYNLFSFDTSAANTPLHYLVNTNTGDRIVLVSQKDNSPIISPAGAFAVWYNPAKDGYYSYEIKTGKFINITPALKGLLKPVSPNGRLTGGMPYGIAGWLPGDSDLLIYDEYDIWKVDVSGVRRPVNITKGYGRRHKIMLRIWANNRDYEATLINEPTVLLCAFATESKKNGFFRINPQQVQEPVQLTMDDCLYYAHSRFNLYFARNTSIYKAAGSKMYLVRRMRADQYPGLFVTSDFRQFTPLATVQPEAAYNWMKAELIHYTTTGGKQAAGILYKPSDFDSTRKYPVIFYFYEKISVRLHEYMFPNLSQGLLDIPLFVSNGYLVCTPDIAYTKGKTGESALEYVTAAANYVSKLPYVNAKKMGIQGHSFGGYEVNYIVAKSNLFAAAQPSSGASDFISYYNGNYRESSAQFYFETGQGRIGNTLWEKPELFQQNSPVYYANRVTTPVLIMHNKEDGEVPFQQGLEWFTALKRLGKKVWLLQYDKEHHVIIQKKNQLDYTIRMKQFFDHYLKGAPQPVWMKQGIPVAVKNNEDGLGY